MIGSLHALLSASVEAAPPPPGNAPSLVSNNTGATTQIVSFGQAFKEGAIPAGNIIVSDVGTLKGTILTTHPDGSARFAACALQVPAGAAVTVQLSAGSGSAGTPPDFSAHAASMVIDGTTYNLLTAGTLVDNQRSNSISHSMRRSIPITGFSHAYARIIVDLEVRSDGSLVVDWCVRNDRVMTSGSGGLIFPTISVVVNGATKYSQTDLKISLCTAYGRRHVVNTSGTTLVEPYIVQDRQYLADAGRIPHYDFALSLHASLAVNAAAEIADAGVWDAKYSARSLSYYFPTTGDANGIGEYPYFHAAWLCSGTRVFFDHMIGQAEQAYTIPWHFHMGSKWLDYTDYPTNALWTDGRDARWSLYWPTNEPGSPATTPSSPWSIDNAHMPNPHAIPYLITGRRHFHDELMAQACWALGSHWPFSWSSTHPEGRGTVLNIATGEGVYLSGPAQQLRGTAWALVKERWAAWAATDSYERGLWQNAIQGHLNALKVTATRNAARFGEIAGFLHNEINDGSGETHIATFMHYFYIHALCSLADDGYADAVAVLGPVANWESAKHLQNPLVFTPENGLSVGMDYYYAGTTFTTWAQMEARQEVIAGQGGAPKNMATAPRWAYADGISGPVGIPYQFPWAAAGWSRLIRRFPAKTDLVTVHSWLMASDAPAGRTAAQYALTPKQNIVHPGFTRG